MRRITFVALFLSLLLFLTSCQVAYVLGSESALTKWEADYFELYVDDTGSNGVLVYKAKDKTLVFNVTGVYNDLMVYDRFENEENAKPVAIYDPSILQFENWCEYNLSRVVDPKYADIFKDELIFKCVDAHLNEDEILYEWQPLSEEAKLAVRNKADS